MDLLFSKLVLTLTGYCSKELQEECKKILDMKTITNSSAILEQIRAVTGVVDNWKTKSHISGDTLPKYNIEKFNNTYNNIQDSFAKISGTNEVNIGELKTELKTLFETLMDIVFGQSKQIIELESRITALEETKITNENRTTALEETKITNENRTTAFEETKTTNENRMLKLEKKLKMMEKSKIIGDLLDPLVKVGGESEVTIIFPHLMFFFHVVLGDA
jgi:chromosome segregation ATPase